MSVTKRGVLWELRNSIWILWSFVFFCNYVGFIWVGIRGKNKKWLFAAAFCFAIGILQYLIVSANFRNNKTVMDVSIGILLATWLASIVYSFLIRAEYLKRRDHDLSKREETYAKYFGQDGNTLIKPSKQEVNSEALISETTISPVTKNLVEREEIFPKTGTSVTQIPVDEINEVKKQIDLNTCSEQELSDLPGFSVAKAKKAILLRREKNGFQSFDDFIMSLEIPYQFAKQIEPLIKINPLPPADFQI